MNRTPLTGLFLLGAGLFPWPGLAQEVPRSLPRPVMAQEVPRSLARPTGGWIGLAVDLSQVSLRGVPQAAAIITQVVAGSPAEAAGIQAGDTLLRLDGQSVSERAFAALPGTLQPGDLVRLTITREGRLQDIMVEAAPRPSPFPAMAPILLEMALRLDTIRGAILQNLDSLRFNIAGLRPGAFWPGTSFTSPESAIPFESLVFGIPIADSLRNQILRLRQEVTDVRRQELSLQREIQTAREVSAEEAIRREERLAELRAREESLVAEQQSLNERLRRVSEQEVQRQWAEAQARYEESLARMLQEEGEARRRSTRQREGAIPRVPETRGLPSGLSGSPIILGQSVMLGAHLAPLNPDLAAVFSVPEGVFVIQVPAGTPASDAGLMGGDIIVRVGDDEVASLTDLRFGLGTREGIIRMQVIRRGQPVEIVVRR